MKLLKAIIAGSLVLGITATSLSADAVKGQKLFSKLLKEPCGMTGALPFGLHTIYPAPLRLAAALARV